MKLLPLLPLLLAGCSTMDLSDAVIHTQGDKVTLNRANDRPLYILLGKDGSAINMPQRATTIERQGDTILLK